MRKLLSILGTLWAVAALPVILAMFFGFNNWPRLLVAATGLEVSPWYSGGEVAATLDRDGYFVRVHRPVFDGLVGQRDAGFVQVDLVPLEGTPLGAHVVETVTPADDPALAFRLDLDTTTRKAEVTAVGAAVVGVEAVYALDRGFAVRVALRNPR